MPWANWSGQGWTETVTLILRTSLKSLARPNYHPIMDPFALRSLVYDLRHASNLTGKWAILERHEKELEETAWEELVNAGYPDVLLKLSVDDSLDRSDWKAEVSANNESFDMWLTSCT